MRVRVRVSAAVGTLWLFDFVQIDNCMRLPPPKENSRGVRDRLT